MSDGGQPLAPDRTLVKVAVVFFVVFAALQAGAWLLAHNGALDPLLDATADLAGACSRATGVQAGVTGNEIVLANRILRIDLDCTGISLAAVYVALVVAYPLSLRRKLVAIFAGLPVLFVANLARLVAVAQLSGLLDDRTFLFVHDYLFKVVMIAVVVALWGVYLSSARRHATRP